MTTIDQAFVRAYLQETAPNAAPNVAQGAAPLPAAPLQQTAPAPAALEPAGGAPSDRPAAADHRLAVGPPDEIERSTVSRTADATPPAAKPAEADFRPMLQVDAFAWAPQATSLRLAAGIQVDRLADGVTGGIAQGRTVTAIAGCQRYQGCTTLLLCAAKRLADRGLSVALVDADFSHPALAARLGLLPEAGLEAVLAGRLPLEEAAIESVDDRMIVLPVVTPCPRQAAAPEGQAVLAAAVGLLRRHYDLVLVDLGQITLRSHGDAPSGRAVPRWVDSVVLVEDVRNTARSQTVEAARLVEAEGVVNLGVVENFV